MNQRCSIGNGFRVEYNVLQSFAEYNMSNQTRLDHVFQKWIELNGQDRLLPGRQF